MLKARGITVNVEVGILKVLGSALVDGLSCV